MFGLLGPNGAGKSTLMRTIATLQEPDAGSIDLDGLDELREKDEVRRRLGYLPQEFGVHPRVTAAAMLDHFALLKGVTDRKARKDLVETLLVRTNLWEIRKRRLDTFSGGMRRRFGIAQALIGDPELVIVDEPTAGLDPEERNRFHDLLSEIGENVVVLLSTHIVEDVRDLCSRMAILSEGRVLRSGAPQELIGTLRGRIWRRVIERSDLDRWRSEHPVLSTRLSEGRPVIHVEGDRNPGEGFESVEADLRDVYFSTIQRIG
jgi:ABC-type multidrug transport system ATPase subunit